MKILNLKFKNINSLSGENEIDFTNPIFTNDGLFVITGKTGSGKSSILDAISLALYGKTPRVNISVNENEVLTRGEKDCYSEIIFEVSGNKWKSSWKQEINRNGNLKPVSRLIADNNNNIIADQVRSCETKIVEILGLTFEQFTKVIMLAQGSFAAFLQANNNEKGELLEQITGTEIYADISRKVFERNRTEKYKLEKILLELESMKILTEEDKSNLINDINLFVEEKTLNDKASQHLELVKKWLIDIENVQNQIITANQKMPELEKKSKIVIDSFNVAEINLKSVKDEKIKLEPIFIKVRELETKITEKDNLLNPLINVIVELEKNRNNLYKIQRNFDSELEISQTLLISKQEWAFKNSKYEELVSNYSAIEREDQQIVELSNEIKNYDSKITKLKIDRDIKSKAAIKANKVYNEKNNILINKSKELEDKITELDLILNSKDITTILSDKDKISFLISKVSKLIEIKTNIEVYCNEINNINSNLIKFEKSIEEIKPQIEADKITIINLENQINLLDDNIKLTKTIISLDEHRKNLQDGVECPLCGSLNHPFAMGNIPAIGEKDNELKLLKKQFKIATDELQFKENILIKISTDLGNAQQNKGKEQKALLESTKKKDALLNELNNISSIIAKYHDEIKIDQLNEILKENELELNKISNIIEKTTIIENQIKNLQNIEIPALQNEKQLIEKEKNEAEIALRLAEQDLTNLQELITNYREKFQKENSYLVQKFQNYLVNNLDELKNCLNDWLKNKKQIEELTLKITEIKNNIVVNNKDLQVLIKTYQDKQNEKQDIDKEKQRLIAERIQLFAEKSIDKEEYRIKKLIESSENNKEKAELEKHNILTEIEKNIAIISEKKQQLEKLQEQTLSDENIEEITNELAKKKKLIDDYSQKIGANKQALKSNDESLKVFGKKLENKELQQSICRKWGKLNELIGSGDGKKYRNFAQSLTFEHLISFANKQLIKMSERYILKRTIDTSNPFELFVVDKFQNNEQRTAQNLSGGEKFIVSLSLALGLANMASKNMRIDTMFIDEGFGTLDSDYLDVALSALSNLQNEGKIIGVISHLTELKERIATHIEVVPGGNGHSKILIRN